VLGRLPEDGELVGGVLGHAVAGLHEKARPVGRAFSCAIR